MLCEKCGKAEATIHSYPDKPDPARERHVCFQCSGETTKTFTIIRQCVVTYDQDGKEIGREFDPKGWEEPVGTTVRNGLEAIRDAAVRLFASQEESSALLVHSVSESERPPIFLSIRRAREEAAFNAMFTHHHSPQIQCAVIDFFSRRGLRLKRDAGVVTKFMSRNLWYSVPATSEVVTEIATNLLRECYRVRYDDGLRFTFHRA